MRRFIGVFIALLFAAAAHAQLLPVPRGSYPNFVGDGYFFANGDDTHADLWRTDGTAAGTRLVQELDDRAFVSGVGAINGKAIYVTLDAIWAADANGVTKLAQMPQFGYLSAPAVVFDGALYFGVAPELVRTDGTPEGTQHITLPGNMTSPRALAVAGNTLFVVTTGFSGVSDLYAIRRGIAPEHVALLVNKDGFFLGMQPVGDHMFIVMRDYHIPQFATDLWVSDGTAGGTKLLRRRFGDVPVAPIGTVNGELLFAGHDETHGVELWTSDGTTAGTRLLADLVEGYRSSTPRRVGSDDTRTYLQAGGFLWSITSTGAMQQIAPLDGDAQEGVAWNGRVFFPVASMTYGNELWVTDGTASGTHRIADLHRGPGSGVRNLRASDQGVLFGGDDGTSGVEPWITDGSAPRLLRNVASEGVPESDDDGVPDAAEDGAVENGDANGDGSRDKFSARVASVRTRYDEFTVVSSCDLREVRTVGIAGEKHFVWSQRTFEAIEFQMPCASATVTVLFLRALGATTPASSRFIAYTADAGWAVLPATIVTAEYPQRATFSVSDGGPGDDSPAGDGRIVVHGTLADVFIARDRSVRH